MTMDYYAMTNQAIAEEIGRRIEQRRLELNIAQSDIAKEAGISANTYRAAVGGKAKLEVLIAILRHLGELEQVDNMLSDRPYSPIARLKMEGKTRKRASSSAHDEPAQEEDLDW